MIDTILFDLEGVIIDTENTVWVPSVQEFLKRRNSTYDKEIIQPLMLGKNMREGVKILQDYYHFSGDLDDLATERRELTKKYFETNIDFIPGFLDFFAKVQKKYKTAIGSSIERQPLEIANNKVHLSDLFGEHIYIIEDVNFISKPNPDIYLYAAKKVGSIPNTCVVIEDAPNGIESARNAGMKSIGLATTLPKEKLQRATMIVNNYTEINLSKL